MNQELPKAYDPHSVEKKWYPFWEKRNFFAANELSEKPPYCIVIPPPNITGVLHMGHALVNTLQDVLIRWKRMDGHEALWLPGVDHAGIATQTVVERHLMAKTGKRRKEFPREEFLSHIWDWKAKNEHTIVNQLKKMGCSCDWKRARFTMDEASNRAVRTMFKKLYDKGLIYRGHYLVNWDPVTQTALADDEVEYEERDHHLWYFRYPLADGSGHVTIATTRPETMLGDTAVAVSPKDERYQHLIGKSILLPLMEREIPLIADNYVDPEFGSGVVKITPAHDHNDYQIGLRHHLPMINVMTPDGKINEEGGAFAGMEILEAREAVVKAMEERGLLEKTVRISHRVSISYRSKATIEPFLSKQWFIRMDGFALKMRRAVDEGAVSLIPQNWERTYFHWIDNLRDWCISRQLWWGHRIPIWYHKEDEERMICYDGEGLPPEVEKEPEAWRQEEDVLDTWFSSALWPFSTLGWPEETATLQKFYPNSVLVTGYDILFFWVARMVMMGEEAMAHLPFPDVFLHGLIYGKSYWRDTPGGGISYVTDEERLEYDLGKALPQEVHCKWEKMSKSKGNIIDPLEVIEQYGTDAMRLGLCVSAPQSREIDLDRRKFEEFKNFTNKIWNGARFVFMNLDANDSAGLPALSSTDLAEGLSEECLALEDRWILSSLNDTIRRVNDSLGKYEFDQAAFTAYDFFWKEFCAYYVEISKPVLFGKAGSPEERRNKQRLLVHTLCATLRLLHPFAPFITEELFGKLKERFADLPASIDKDPYTKSTCEALHAEACIVAPYPHVIRAEDINTDIQQTFQLMENVIYTLRNIRGEMKLPPTMAMDVIVVADEEDPLLSLLRENSKIVTALVRTRNMTFNSTQPSQCFGATGVVESLKLFVPLPDELKEQEKKRLHKELERLSKNVEKTKAKLSNQNFVEKAPKELVQQQEELLLQNEQELATVSEKLEKLC